MTDIELTPKDHRRVEAFGPAKLTAEAKRALEDVAGTARELDRQIRYLDELTGGQDPDVRRMVGRSDNGIVGGILRFVESMRVRETLDASSERRTHRGVQWAWTAFRLAEEAGAHEDITDLVLLVGEGGCGVTVIPDPGFEGRRKIIGDEWIVYLDADDAVLRSWRVVKDDGTRKAAANAPVVTRGPRKSRPAASRGPSTWEELEEWLVEDGCKIRVGGTGHKLVTLHGRLVGSYPSTGAMRGRGVDNAVATIRRNSGLRLRRSS